MAPFLFPQFAFPSMEEIIANQARPINSHMRAGGRT